MAAGEVTRTDDQQLLQTMQDAVWNKELKHKINEGDAFQRASRSMSQIGG